MRSYSENVGLEQVNTMAVKRVNVQRIFQLLYWERELTQMEIKKYLQLSSPTITQVLQTLRRMDILEDGAEVESSGGRKPRCIAFNYRAACSVGVEIRRHSMEIVIVQLDGTVLSSAVERANFDNTAQYWKHMNACIRKLIDTTQGVHNVLGVGIAFPGEVSFGNHIIERATVFGLENVPLDDIRRHFDFNVYIENGASTAGFGAAWRDRDLQDAVYIIVTDDGVAGTIILNNRIFRGCGKAGAFGHMTLDPHGKHCFCGGQGCWSAYCALSNLTALTDGSLNMFFEKVKDGDAECCGAWDTYLNNFALALKTIILSLDLNVVIGGKLAPYLENYLDVLRAKVQRHPALKTKIPNIMIDQLDGNAIAVGAAMIFVSRLVSGETDLRDVFGEEESERK